MQFKRGNWLGATFFGLVMGLFVLGIAEVIELGPETYKHLGFRYASVNFAAAGSFAETPIMFWADSYLGWFNGIGLAFFLWMVFLVIEFRNGRINSRQRSPWRAIGVLALTSPLLVFGALPASSLSLNLVFLLWFFTAFEGYRKSKGLRYTATMSFFMGMLTLCLPFSWALMLLMIPLVFIAEVNRIQIDTGGFMDKLGSVDWETPMNQTVFDTLKTLGAIAILPLLFTLVGLDDKSGDLTPDLKSLKLSEGALWLFLGNLGFWIYLILGGLKFSRNNLLPAAFFLGIGFALLPVISTYFAWVFMPSILFLAWVLRLNSEFWMKRQKQLGVGVLCLDGGIKVVLLGLAFGWFQLSFSPISETYPDHQLGAQPAKSMAEFIQTNGMVNKVKIDQSARLIWAFIDGNQVVSRVGKLNQPNSDNYHFYLTTEGAEPRKPTPVTNPTLVFRAGPFTLWKTTADSQGVDTSLLYFSAE